MTENEEEQELKDFCYRHNINILSGGPKTLAIKICCSHCNSENISVVCHDCHKSNYIPEKEKNA